MKTPEINEVKKWLSDNGIGTGTNITVGAVAQLIVSYYSQLSQPSDVSDFEKLLIEIHEWQVKTFGEANALSKVRHLQKETEELADDIISSAYIGPENRMLRQEYADCFLLLFGSAMAANFSFRDISNCMSEKLEINKTRKWGKPDKNGVVEHIEDGQIKPTIEGEDKQVNK